MRSLALLATLLGAEVQEEPVLVVVPLGKASPDLLEIVAESLRSTFRLRVEIGEAQSMPNEAWYPKRSRWRAEKLLDHLEATAPSHAWRVAAITEEPISTTKGSIYDWGIAGLGTIGGKSSVFTSHLFRKHAKTDRAKYLKEMKGLVIHEVGHTLGLDHCPLERCVMADAKGNAIRAAELTNNEFCPKCRDRIRDRLRGPKLQLNLH